MELNRFRMKRQMAEFDLKFSPVRHEILESLQIKLAYLFRKLREKRLEKDRQLELIQIEEAALAKKLSSKEKRIQAKKVELQRVEAEK